MVMREGAHRRINPLGLIGIGNGAYSLSYGHILVGTHRARGCVIQSRTALTNLYWRIEKALRRGLDVRLTIDETKPPWPPPCKGGFLYIISVRVVI